MDLQRIDWVDAELAWSAKGFGSTAAIMAEDDAEDALITNNIALPVINPRR